MNKRVIAKNLDWNEIRVFLVRRRFFRGNELDEESYDAICDRRFGDLSYTLMRELSVYIDGYLHGRGTCRGQNRR